MLSVLCQAARNGRFPRLPALVPNSLCLGQEKRTMRKPKAYIGNSG
jgi:hypothetical protein